MLREGGTIDRQMEANRKKRMIFHFQHVIGNKCFEGNIIYVEIKLVGIDP